MNKYPSYKDSGIEWIGEKPSHWEVVPNRALFWNRSEKNNKGLLPYSVSIQNGVTKQTYSEDEIIRSSEDKSNYKRICAGDIVYNKMRMWQGAVGLSPAEGIVSPAYIVCAPRKKFELRYFEYLFRTPDYIGYSGKYSYGLCDDMNSLRFKDFKIMYSLFPPVSEQQAIADFLDEKTALIDELIDKKKRQIELLTEQRQAAINQAVTKGLNPNVEMKDSGIEWIGEIPKHWQLKKGKYLFTIISGFAPEQIEFSDDASNRYFRVDDLNSDADSLFLRNSKATFTIGDISLYPSEIVLFPKRGVACPHFLYQLL
ncbi:MAG: restriction endonuclease subunit S [Planctomycetota bacterium]|jgi:type I restriction enzyme S subunit